MSIADPWEGSTASYMQRSFEFTGKEYKIDLSALHGFGGCAKRVNARSPFMSRDDPKIGSPHILCPVKHQSGSVSPITFPNIEAIPLVFDMYEDFIYSQYSSNRLIYWYGVR